MNRFKVGDIVYQQWGRTREYFRVVATQHWGGLNCINKSGREVGLGSSHTHLKYRLKRD